MKSIHLERIYPHPPQKVWRALTDPAALSAWLMQVEGFAPEVGARFKLIAKPQPGWRGWVECEVTEVDPPRRIAWSWQGDEQGPPLQLSLTLEPQSAGTRVVVDHAGFTGLSGWMSRFLMTRGWRDMLASRLPAVLAAA